MLEARRCPEPPISATPSPRRRRLAPEPPIAAPAPTPNRCHLSPEPPTPPHRAPSPQSLPRPRPPITIAPDVSPQRRRPEPQAHGHGARHPRDGFVFDSWLPATPRRPAKVALVPHRISRWQSESRSWTREREHGDRLCIRHRLTSSSTSTVSSTTAPSSGSTRRPGPSSTPSSSDAAGGGGTPLASAAAAGCTPSSSAAAGGCTPSSSVPAAGGAPSPATTTSVQDGTPIVNLDDYECALAVGVKRKRKSSVWLEFEEVTVAGKDKVQCNWCKKLLVGGSKDGTKHLHNHLNCCASRQAQKGLKQSTLKLGKYQNGAVVVEKYVFDQLVARKELALMICVHEYPLSMVDHVGFRRFCSALQPLLKHMSRNTIKSDILGMYEVYKQQLMVQLQKCQSRIVVTMDMWTVNHQRKGYMAVTVYYLDDEWKLKILLLRFIYVPAPDTAEVIHQLQEVLHD